MKKLHPENHIKKLRKSRGFTAKQLGDAIGMTGQAITLLENRERTLKMEVAKRIADVLECHFLDVVSGPISDDKIAKNDQERRLLVNFRAMQDREQHLYLAMGETFSKEGSPEKNPGKK